MKKTKIHDTHLWTLADVARATKLHPHSVVNWENAGLISPIYTSGRHSMRIYTDKMIGQLLRHKSTRLGMDTRYCPICDSYVTIDSIRGVRRYICTGCGFPFERINN